MQGFTRNEQTNKTNLMNELANSLKPGVIHKINHSSSFGAMDNVAEFRQACKLMELKMRYFILILQVAFVLEVKVN